MFVTSNGARCPRAFALWHAAPLCLPIRAVLLIYVISRTGQVKVMLNRFPTCSVATFLNNRKALVFHIDNYLDSSMPIRCCHRDLMSVTYAIQRAVHLLYLLQSYLHYVDRRAYHRRHSYIVTYICTYLYCLNMDSSAECRRKIDSTNVVEKYPFTCTNVVCF